MPSLFHWKAHLTMTIKAHLCYGLLIWFRQIIRDIYEEICGNTSFLLFLLSTVGMHPVSTINNWLLHQSSTYSCMSEPQWYFTTFMTQSKHICIFSPIFTMKWSHLYQIHSHLGCLFLQCILVSVVISLHCASSFICLIVLTFIYITAARWHHYPECFSQKWQPVCIF